MEELYREILENVNVLYIFMCNLITYIILDLIENGGHKHRDVARVWKRLISAVSAICIGFVMKNMYVDEPFINRQLFYGFFIQFLTWDYVFKSIIEGLKNKFEVKGTKKTLE